MWLKEHEANYVALWADGYLPSLERMKKIEHQLVNISKKTPCSTGGTDYPLIPQDEIFEELMGALKDDLYNEAEHKPGNTCDFFLLRFKKHQHPSELYVSLYDEYFHEARKEQYRSIIAVYNQRNFPRGEKAVQNLLKTLEFELKNPKGYQDYHNFKKYGSVILHEILKTYAAPHAASRDTLNQLGFVCQPHIL